MIMSTRLLLCFEYLLCITTLTIRCSAPEINLDETTQAQRTCPKDEQSRHDIMCNLPGHLGRFGASGPSILVDAIAGFPDVRTFLTNYVQVLRPVVMKQAVTHSRAYLNWSDMYLANVAKQARHGKKVFTCETSKKEVRNRPPTELSLQEFLRAYNHSELYIVDDVPEFLEGDVPLPCPLQCPEILGIVEAVKMWFSSGGTSSVVHVDGVHNIICVYRGTKDFVMLDPEAYGSKVEINPDGSITMDMDRVDLEQHPHLVNAKFFTASLEPGDCMFIPYLWIHQVRSHHSNLATNIWWSHQDTLSLMDSGHCMDILKCDRTMTIGNISDSILTKKT